MSTVINLEKLGRIPILYMRTYTCYSISFLWNCFSGRCFERSAETMDEMDLQIQSQFLRPLDTFLKSESKSLMPREKELSKLADKMVMAKSEGVMTQVGMIEQIPW